MRFFDRKFCKFLDEGFTCFQRIFIFFQFQGEFWCVTGGKQDPFFELRISTDAADSLEIDTPEGKENSISFLRNFLNTDLRSLGTEQCDRDQCNNRLGRFAVAVNYLVHYVVSVGFRSDGGDTPV